MATSFLLPPGRGAEDVDMDPYVVACRLLREAGVPFLVIGGFGVNLHATEGGMGIVTYDLDLLLPAKADAVGSACRALVQAGFALTWNGEDVPLPEGLLLGDIVRARACLRASLDGRDIDLVLHAEGLDFDELWSRREARTIGSAHLDTIPLADRLLSKSAANRARDRLFIETWREVLDQMLAAEARRSSPRASGGEQAASGLSPPRPE